MMSGLRPDWLSRMPRWHLPSTPVRVDFLLAPTFILTLEMPPTALSSQTSCIIDNFIAHSIRIASTMRFSYSTCFFKALAHCFSSSSSSCFYSQSRQTSSFCADHRPLSLSSSFFKRSSFSRHCRHPPAGPTDCIAIDNILLMVEEGTLDESTTFKQLLRDHSYPDDLLLVVKAARVTFPHPLQKMFLQSPGTHSLLQSTQTTGKSLASLLYLLKDCVARQKFILAFVGPAKNYSSTMEASLKKWLKGLPSITVVNLSTTKDFDHQQFARLVLVGTWEDLQRNERFYKGKIDGVAAQQVGLIQCFGWQKQAREVGTTWGIEKWVAMDGDPRVLDEDREWQSFQCEQSQQVKQRLRQQRLSVSQYYVVGDQLCRFTVLYIVFKLHFVVGKTLLICKDTPSVYKVAHFLQRVGVRQVQLYNSDNPKHLKYYTISTFNGGAVTTLVATADIFKDLRDPDIRHRAAKLTKRAKVELKGLDNVIAIGLQNLPSHSNLFELFHGCKGLVLNLVLNQETQLLGRLFQEQKQQFCRLNFKEFPLSKPEIERFRYRTRDLEASLTSTAVKHLMDLDFKNKLLKSKDMTEYFQQNPAEKAKLVHDIGVLRKRIEKSKVVDMMPVPDYLIPACLSSRRSIAEPQYKRRRNYEPEPEQVSKVRVAEGGAKRVYVHEEDQEQPEAEPQMDEFGEDRKPLTNRQLWKMKHGFGLKKKHNKLQKKGIFIAESY